MISAEELKLQKPGEVRVRFAPSPTGYFHIANARAALFNYIFAKQNEGSFVLRIEDTDKERSKPEYEKDILENLKWLGIEWSEGPDTGGPYEPYRQSERLNLYAKYLQRLLDEDKAYYCFCSEQDLETQRQYQMSIGEAPHYSGKCANLNKDAVKKYLAEGKSAVIRFRVPAKKVEFQDLIRGHVEFDTSLMGDIVVAKDLKSPLYNFSVVIDDFEMKISHIIRGEDHISNTPKQILLEEAFGFPQPKFVHLPIILGSDRTKMSKRHGSVSINDFRKQGYLPETLVNFIAFLGWNPGDEREIYSLPSLIKEFTLDKVQKAGAVFNVKRLDFLNGFYIRQKSLEKLTELCLPYLIENNLIDPVYETKERVPNLTGYFGKEIVQEYAAKETGEKVNFEYLGRVVSIYQERLKKLSEIVELTDFFFKDEINYDKSLLKWKEMSDEEIRTSLDKLEKILSKIKEGDWLKENLENILMPEAEKTGDRGYLLWPFRAALSGKQASAGPFEIAAILGKEKTIKRINNAKLLISK